MPETTPDLARAVMVISALAIGLTMAGALRVYHWWADDINREWAEYQRQQADRKG
jgi:hypothetical protein